jgi:hypothetical protein
MKTPRFVFILGWALLIVTGLAGFGASHFFESALTPQAHALLGALGQLIPLAGLFILALLTGKSRHSTGAPPPEPPEGHFPNSA